jgi:(p)ppGpp synthase/HD superfamily hydrolase
MSEITDAGIASAHNKWKARAEAAEADARRYRWLRAVGDRQDLVWATAWGSPEEVDAAIDAELAKEGEA